MTFYSVHSVNCFTIVMKYKTNSTTSRNIETTGKWRTTQSTFKRWSKANYRQNSNSIRQRFEMVMNQAEQKILT